MTLRLLLLLLTCVVAHGQMALMFTWDEIPETNIVGYRLLSGPKPRVYTTTNEVVGRTNVIGAVSNVPPGKVFFTVVAIDAAGVETEFSNEVVFTNRVAGPKNFRLFGTFQSAVSPAGPWKDLARLSVPVPPPVEGQQFFRTRLLLEEER